MMEAGKQMGPYPRFQLRGHLAARDRGDSQGTEERRLHKGPRHRFLGS